MKKKLNKFSNDARDEKGRLLKAAEDKEETAKKMFSFMFGSTSTGRRRRNIKGENLMKRLYCMMMFMNLYY